MVINPAHALLLLLLLSDNTSSDVTMTQRPLSAAGTYRQRRGASPVWRCPASRDQNALDDINLDQASAAAARYGTANAICHHTA